MKFLQCVLYVFLLGVASGIIGSWLPREWFHADRPPYRCRPWEDGGKVYLKLHIRDWKDRVPDMSKISKRLYRKSVDTTPNYANLQRLIAETCVAEFMHYVILLLSLMVLRIWRGKWGAVFYLLCILWNLPCILIQRFNRPRLQKTLKRMESKKTAEPAE